jgi:hypothetical protein
MEASMTSAWHEAATDLGITVEAPATVADRACVAFLPDFGSASGVAVLSLGDRGDTTAVKATGCFVSKINPNVYGAYDREAFIEMLDDWGWFGHGDPPSWYSGASA